MVAQHLTTGALRRKSVTVRSYTKCNFVLRRKCSSFGTQSELLKPFE